MFHVKHMENKIMIVGTPKEIKNHEYRVGLTPESAHELVAHGHTVLVETGAGDGIGAHDADYIAAGAEVVATAADVFARADMVVKVKEPQAVERAIMTRIVPDPEAIDAIGQQPHRFRVAR